MMNSKIEELKEKASLLPLLPGVYQMKNNDDEIIYIGKAKALKNRVSQYFAQLSSHSPKTLKMISQVDHFETINTTTEFEALLLECALIKKHKPKYNILLKDDKGYPFIRLSKDDYPRFKIVSKPADDGARYFGPYGGRSGAKTAMTTALVTFKLPTCSLKFPRDIGKSRPCLNAHIGRCCAVCAGNITQQQYMSLINQACLLMDGKHEGLKKELERQMMAAAEEMQFEHAAQLRDRMRAVEKLGTSQLIISGALSDTDFVAFSLRGSRGCVVMLNYVDGNLLDKKTEFYDGVSESDAPDVLEGFIKQYYTMTARAPKLVVISSELADVEILSEWLSSLRGSKTTISVPQRGEKRQMLDMAIQNAEQELQQLDLREQKTAKSLEMLAEILGLKSPPLKIEAYDISHMAGTNAVAGMTVLKDGRPARASYRKFKISDAAAGDDYASLAETIDRRLTRAESGDAGFLPLPDLFLIDGGAGQVSTVAKTMAYHGCTVPVFGMVKDDHHRTHALVDAQNREFGIKTMPPVFSLVGTLQEETHRYAITFQKQTRSKSVKTSILSKIPGLGAERIKLLRKKLGTIEKIKTASAEELAQIVPKNVAAEIIKFFEKQNRAVEGK